MRPTGVTTTLAMSLGLVAFTVVGCSGTSPAPSQTSSGAAASGPSSQELAASCTAFAASDRSSAPQLTFAIAKSLAGTAVPLCVMPKPGHDGVPRLDGSTAKMTTATEWAEAISVDRPVPSGVSVSQSWDLYAWVNGEWRQARLAGMGTNAN